MVLNHNTSVYDKIWRYAARQEGWLRYDDGEVYPLNLMLSPVGLAGVQAMAARWLAHQEALFSPADVADSGAGDCSL